MKSKLNNKDFWSGVMFVVVGAMFAGIASTYKLTSRALYGTSMEMGPGFFPFWLGILLIVLGVGTAVGGVRPKGPALERFHWRPVLTVLISVCIFGVLLKVLGMLVAGVVLVIGASFGSHEFKWREVVLLAAALAIFCALVFVAGLKLPIPLCPGTGFFEQFAVCRE